MGSKPKKKNKSHRRAKAVKLAKEAAENNDKIESSEVEPEPENPKVYIDAPPPKENPWLKNKPQLSEPEVNNSDKEEHKPLKEQPVIKQSTAENRPPPTQSTKPPQPQPKIQPSTMPASKPTVSSKKSITGSPWKTPPVEQAPIPIQATTDV